MNRVLIALCFVATVAVARTPVAAPPASTAGTPVRPPPPAAAASAKPIASLLEEPETRFYQYKLVTALGLNLLRSSAVAVSGQFGYAFDKSMPLYVGPDLSFSLFSPGSAFLTMVGGWYELRVFGSPRLSIGLGAGAGAAFCQSLAGISNTTYAFFADTFIAQDFDDLSSVRLQLRPGLIGGYFSFLMNFNVAFRFL